MTRLPDPARSRAYLFGSASFQADGLPDLPAVANNLEALRTVLTSGLSGFTPDRCTVRLDPPAPASVFQELRQHAADAEDTLLVYFAGHGLVRGVDLYLALPGTQDTSLEVSAFDYDWLRTILDDSTTANKIVILDCCYSGRAVYGMSGGGLVTAEQLEVEGSYTLTSAPATRPSVAVPGQTYTAFTEQLLLTLNEGVPGAGELLTLDVIAAELRRRTRKYGLPSSEQRSGGTTHLLALARNAAAPGAGAVRPPGRTAPGAGAVRPPLPGTPSPRRVSLDQTYVGRPLVLTGKPHATRRDLAATIRRNWPVAADRFFRRMGTAQTPSEGWSELRSWLRQFNDPRTDDVEGRIVLVDRYLTDEGLSPDHKLLHLLRWLDPEGPPVYRGRRITYGTLARAALARHAGGNDAGARLLEELSHSRLLDTLAGFRRLDRLRGVRRKWDAARAAWAGATGSGAPLPAEVRAWADRTGPGALLLGLLPPWHIGEVLNELPAGTRPPEPAAPWYARLAGAAGSRETPLGRLVEAEWAERARQEALARAERARQEALARAEKQRVQQRRRLAELREKETREPPGGSAGAEQARQEALARAEERRRGAWRRLAELEERRQQEEERRRQEEERRRRAGQEVREGLREPAGPPAVRRPREPAGRPRPAARALAVLRALAVAAVWPLLPIVVVWSTWWWSSYEYDAAVSLTLLAGLVSFAALYGLLPCAVRLGAACRPRLGAPSSWLPPVRSVVAAVALMLLFALVGHDSSSRSGDLRADSDLLRKDWQAFSRYVGQNGSSTSASDFLVLMVFLFAAAGCAVAGWYAGRTLARRWEGATVGDAPPGAAGRGGRRAR